MLAFLPVAATFSYKHAPRSHRHHPPPQQKQQQSYTPRASGDGGGGGGHVGPQATTVPSPTSWTHLPHDDGNGITSPAVSSGPSTLPSSTSTFRPASTSPPPSTSTATPQPQPPYPSLSTHQAASRHAARRHTASRHAAAYAAARVQNFAASPPAPHCKSPHLRGNVLLTDQSVGMVPPIMPGQPREVFDLTGDDDDVAIKNEPTVKTEPSIKTESSGQGGSSPLVPAPNRLEWLFGNFKHALNTMPNYQVYQLWYL